MRVGASDVVISKWSILDLYWFSFLAQTYFANIEMQLKDLGAPFPKFTGENVGSFDTAAVATIIWKNDRNSLTRQHSQNLERDRRQKMGREITSTHHKLFINP